MKLLNDLIDRLKNIAPVIMVLGNHDLSIKEDLELRSLFKKLKRKNVYPLDNESIEFDDIRFSGFYPIRKAYAISHITNKKVNMIIDDWNKYNLEINKDKFNILCHHIPYTIFDKRVQEKASTIYDYDLILSGHAHNGWLSPKQEDKLNKRIDKKLKDITDEDERKIINDKRYGGFCESISNKPPFRRKYCRGIHEINNTKLIISKGITSGLKVVLKKRTLISTNSNYAYITIINIGGDNK